MIIIIPCCVFWKGWRGAADKCKGRKTPFVGGDSLLLLTLVIIIIIICITILSMHIVVKWTMVPHTSHCICVPLCCYVLGAPVRLLVSSGQSAAVWSVQWSVSSVPVGGSQSHFLRARKLDLIQARRDRNCATCTKHIWLLSYQGFWYSVFLKQDRDWLLTLQICQPCFW